MHLLTFETRARALRLGALDGDSIVNLAAVAEGLGRAAGPVASALDFLRAAKVGPDLAAELVDAAQSGPPGWRQPLSGTRLRAPVPEPRKILCLAGNYAEPQYLVDAAAGQAVCRVADSARQLTGAPGPGAP